MKVNVRLGALALFLCLVSVIPTPAAAQEGGVIAGTVSSGGTGVGGVTPLRLRQRRPVHAGSGSTDETGHYQTTGLLPGTYYIATYATYSDKHLIDELHSNIPCPFFILLGPSGSCDPTTGQAVTVTNGGTTPVNFDLVPGARIGGVVTDAATGLPIESIYIYVYDPSGNLVAFATTNAAGQYVTRSGLLPGTYHAFTFSVFGHVNENWDDIPCAAFCYPAGGTPIVVGAQENRSNINFALSSAAGGTLSGTVRAAGSNAPIANARVNVYDTLGRFVTSAITNAAGSYTIPLRPGTYFVIGSADGFLKEQVVTRGTLVTISSGGTSNADFTLTPGGRISGVVRDATARLSRIPRSTCIRPTAAPSLPAR